ncbi:ATP-binding protein [Cupriavidus basilensis]
MVDAALDGAGMVRVSVRDRGPASPPTSWTSSSSRSIRRSATALGLGLSISRTIVEMHGGHIWAENNTGQGATFHFTLPIAAEAEPIHSGQRP